MSLILGGTSFSYSQNKTPQEVDIETYNLYIAKKWNELIEVGKQSKREGVDFYYLKVRMGIAYYSLGKYRKAIPFFEKAFNKNIKDEFVGEYLYYSYLFGGRGTDANAFLQMMPDEFVSRLGLSRPKLFKSVDVSGGMANNADFDNLSDADIDGNRNLFGEQTLIGNFY